MKPKQKFESFTSLNLHEARKAQASPDAGGEESRSRDQ